MILTNKNQKKIVKVIKEKIMEHMTTCSESGPTFTFVPYYDIVLNDELKSQLIEVPMAPSIEDRVKATKLKTMMKDQAQSANKVLK